MCVDPNLVAAPVDVTHVRRFLTDLVGTPCISLRGEGADGIARDAQLSPQLLSEEMVDPLAEGSGA